MIYNIENEQEIILDYHTSLTSLTTGRQPYFHFSLSLLLIVPPYDKLGKIFTVIMRSHAFMARGRSSV